ncbi:hypothetical protein F3Y22_tig00112226pilonHSYRG00068 [Hibiscus syriacus]|uniref:Uncharacterized protein n=1 Tax=Hibiscus syriacus TaxID=106335 RepID=A0A6A2X4F0_HIBSY|nr:uncharacterized protein LOC120176056 [Hibiscus syriacus]KAE8669658.1 hypothetical protein F3Y22_tig00112226pilonHSYRG00068 [Hibiscus syriacus]
MASACVNNIGVPPESFQFGWLSPRISFSREEESSSKSKDDPESTEIRDVPAGEFEFRLVDPASMLPADELFSDGKLMPLHLSAVKQQEHEQERRHQHPSLNAIRSRETSSSCPGIEMEVSGSDHYLFSPKAPSCSSRWRELLGLKKCSTTNTNNNQQQQLSSKSDSHSSKISSLSNNNPKSLKYFLHRSSKSSSSLESSSSLPLLKISDSKSVSISASRLSLSSSSSSGHEHDDFPRLSLDADKPSPNPFAPSRTLNPNPPRMRMVKPRPGSGSDSNQTVASGARKGRSPIQREPTASRGISVDSPRMNSCGKIVFESLERSSSSPSSFNGGPRFKQRGVERSYSANVRITPVLNVPVCSLRGSSKSGSVFGFGQLFSSSPQKNPSGTNKGHQINSNRSKTTDRNH